MEDSQSVPAAGRTNWRRFAVAVGVPAAVAVGLMGALAQGALAANITVSGTQFKLTADHLEGRGFTQYSGGLNGTIPAAMSGINHADLYNLCQSVAAGPIVLQITAAKDAKYDGSDSAAAKSVQADELLIGMSELGGDATFKNIQIGVDASTLSADGAATHGEPKGFGQQASNVSIDNLKQKAYLTTASSFKLRGMSLKLLVGQGGECF
ncbi:DUF6230 family protein [Actinoplanes regularis]|uniref:Cholesterol esterase n=1 Tax=Actinoplanes regularis TaxID=52697 RepID=A0A239A8H6_9ACTN|nr:DUF6230 family protein [Actinoplanes regularis]GIE87029.1 cholesterol esterase [Actinoplanes regularis]GLW28350.1 cholesterol esterase [Actinoplanes regularis]SNR91742.1 hypothetical protein SAMN06264365_107134 [Actinoplanes regularis]